MIVIFWNDPKICTPLCIRKTTNKSSFPNECSLTSSLHAWCGQNSACAGHSLFYCFWGYPLDCNKLLINHIPVGWVLKWHSPMVFCLLERRPFLRSLLSFHSFAQLLFYEKIFFSEVKFKVSKFYIVKWRPLILVGNLFNLQVFG